MESITEDQILVELEAYFADREADPDGLSVQEMCEKTGLSDTSVQSRLRVFNREGRLECSRRRMTGIDGRNYWIPVYKVTGNGKES